MALAALPSATTAARSGADSAPTTPTRWTSVLSPRTAGMTMAAAMTARMSTVPMRKARPRSRSRSSRAATRPTSPGSGSSLIGVAPGSGGRIRVPEFSRGRDPERR